MTTYEQKPEPCSHEELQERIRLGKKELGIPEDVEVAVEPFWAPKELHQASEELL